MKSFIKGPVSSLIAFLTVTSISYGSWEPDGVPVCTADSTQWVGEVITDGVGGAIITWSDYRNSGTDTDTYSQRISPTGSPLWVIDGVGVCTAADYQFEGKHVADGQGGATIAWADRRDVGQDVYAQHLDESGTASWMDQGVPASVGPNLKEYPEAVSDGAGGVILAWRDHRSGTNLYGQRLNSSGSSLWQLNGLALCTAPDDQWYPHMISDGSAGAILAWSDKRNGNYDVYAQRIDGNGNKLWGPNELPVSSTVGLQDILSYPVSDGNGGAIMAWRDLRGGTGTDDIYAQRVLGNGSIAWALNGIPVVTAAGLQNYEWVVSDGSGGVIIAWEDSRNGAFDIYAQRVDANGSVLWPANGIAVCTEPGDQIGLRMVSDDNGGAFIVWQDNRSGSSFDIYSSRIDSDGQTIGSAGGDVLCGAAGDQIYVRFTSVGNGSAVAVWEDYRNGESDIYAQLITSGVSGVDQNPVTSSKLQLLPNLPNPFRTSTLLQFNVARASLVEIEVYDVSGRKLATRTHAASSDNVQRIIFDGRDDSGQLLPSGVYLYRIIAGAEVISSRFILER